MFIDVKQMNEYVVPAITKLFHKYPDLYNTTSVCSFFPASQTSRSEYYYRSHVVSGVFYAYVERSYRTWFQRMVQTIGRRIFQRVYLWALHNWLHKWTGINLILTHHDSITYEYAKMWRERGVQVVAWTVDYLLEKCWYLNTLKCPFLTDRLSDMQEELKETTIVKTA